MTAPCRCYSVVMNAILLFNPQHASRMKVDVQTAGILLTVNYCLRNSGVSSYPFPVGLSRQSLGTQLFPVAGFASLFLTLRSAEKWSPHASSGVLDASCSTVQKPTGFGMQRTSSTVVGRLLKYNY